MQPTTPVAVSEPTAPEQSPLWPRHLANLFGRPTTFFTSPLALGHTPYVVFAGWCLGAAQAIDRLDQNLIRAEIGRPRPGWNVIAPLVLDSWLLFWAYVVVAGALSAMALWILGGWWYRVRLRWAGARDPDARIARLLYVYSGLVYALPTLAANALRTLMFPNYASAYDSEEIYSLALIVFPFWAVLVSYKAVRAVFGIGGWRTALWFLVLPVLAYVVALGLVATLLALAEGAR